MYLQIFTREQEKIQVIAQSGNCSMSKPNSFPTNIFIVNGPLLTTFISSGSRSQRGLYFYRSAPYIEQISYLDSIFIRELQELLINISKSNLFIDSNLSVERGCLLSRMGQGIRFNYRYIFTLILKLTSLTALCI